MKINGNNLTIEDVVKVVRENRIVSMDRECYPQLGKSRKTVEKMSKGEKSVYGINTGFGEFANIKIKEKDLIQLQVNLLRSHACGVGNPLDDEAVKAAMLLRVNTLLKGYSGVRVELIQKLTELFNKNVIPYIPEKGSLGASGDLVPLAHLSLMLIGEGKGYFNGELMEAKQCLKSAKIEPLELIEKEGLALINGTPIMAAISCFACYDAEILLKAAEIACAMSIEALLGTDTFLYEKIHAVRNIAGQINSAKNLRSLMKNSQIVESHKDCSNVQDSYSLRCSPQVMGMFHETLGFTKNIVNSEINSSCDNPLVFDDNIYSGGNFHGEPIAQAMDFFAISLSEIGNISERRIFRYQDGNLSGLPSCLIKDNGLNNGFMITQYVAASLVSENKILCHPASVDSIPSAANQEDHVSMGTISARKSVKVVENVRDIIAIELLNASQALDFRKPLKPGVGSKRAYKFLRENLEIPFIEKDLAFADYIKTISSNIENLVDYVEEAEKLTV